MRGAPLVLWWIAALGCAGSPSAEPRPEPAAPAPAASAETASERVEVWASYEVDEGWGVMLELEPDGCYHREERVGLADGSDAVTRCTGCLERGIATRLFDAARGGSLVPEERAYGQQVRAPRGFAGHMGGYALVFVRADGTRTAPRDEASARALIAPMQAALNDADRVAAEDPSRCAPAP